MTIALASRDAAVMREATPLTAERVVDRARRRLERHSEIWRQRPLTREIYHRYHRAIDAARSDVPGRDLEVGAGQGSFAELRPETISCDVIPCPWLNCAADAARLPFADESLANIIMIDVLHHVAEPRHFFADAARTLAPGGRIVLLEPYVSPISWIAWKFFHEEGIDMTANPLDGIGPDSMVDDVDPWDANIAIPTLMFWKHLAEFQQMFDELLVVRRERFDMLVMPLSGGFEKRRLIPMPLVPLFFHLERLLAPLASLLSFRCLIVIEKAQVS